MTAVACLAWGSLYWDPGSLPILGWKMDGPIAPVEFLRWSSRGRVTLVLDSHGTPVPCLWSLLDVKDLDEAVRKLQEREGIPDANVDRHIGRWSGGSPPALIPTLDDWAHKRHIDAVIWTALNYSSKAMRERQSAEGVVQYLRSLKEPELLAAREYIQRAPRQIDTAYRRIIETKLNWTCTSD
jgi:hypothetical protein